MVCYLGDAQKISALFAKCDRAVELFNRLFLAMLGHLSCIANVWQDRHAAFQPTTVLQSRHTPPIRTPRCTHLQSVKGIMKQIA